MKKVSVLIAAMAVAILSSSAFAARVPPPPPPTSNTPGGGGGGVGCIALCVPVPPAGNVSDINYRACGDKLAELRRVTVGEVRRIYPQDSVHLVPLCDTVNHTLTEQQTRYLGRGNVQGLIRTIARNPTLMAELVDHGYRVEDVIGIALDPRTAVLYVSHR